MKRDTLHEFRLPDLGEGVHEGEIRAVLVTAGDPVREDQPVLEVETDKVTVEMTSPYTGSVEAIHVAPGQVAQVGDILMTFVVPEIETYGAAQGSTAFATRGGVPNELRTPAAAPQPREQAADPADARQEVRRGPVPATPATRRVARELGIELRAVTPSGPGGRVTTEDVQTFAERQGRMRTPRAWRKRGCGRKSRRRPWPPRSRRTRYRPKARRSHPRPATPQLPPCPISLPTARSNTCVSAR